MVVIPPMPPPPAVTNIGVNRLVKPLLQSRFHGVLSGRLLLITVTGRKSGRRFTIPVQYSERGGVISIGVGRPAEKQWWRNLRGGAPVQLRLRGSERTGQAVAHGDPSTGVTVEVRLD